MEDFFLKKTDIKSEKDFELKTCTPEITEEIIGNFTGENGPGELIELIEQYNVDNEIPLEQRLEYTVGLKSTVLNVLHAYKVSKTWVLIGFDGTMGIPEYNYGPDGKILTSSQALTTTVVLEEDICSVSFGSYPKSIIDTLKATTFKTVPTNIKSVISSLKELYDKCNGLKSCGNYRDMIIAFNNVMKTSNLNEYNYSFDKEAYNTYITVWNQYITNVQFLIHEITNTKMTDDQRKIKILDESEITNENRQNSFTPSEFELISDIMKSE